MERDRTARLIVRAVTRGLIDLSSFDPWDSWHWRRLAWTLRELQSNETREVHQYEFQYWLTRATDNKLDPSFKEEVVANAKNGLNQLLVDVYPWLADQIGEAGAKTQRETLIEQYREMFGQPGDPEYEAMIEETKKVFEQLKRQKPSWEARQAYQR